MKARYFSILITACLLMESYGEQTISEKEINRCMQSQVNLPSSQDWVWNMRAVSMKIPAASEFNEKELIQNALLLKKNGVNTIIDHGSLQFIPGLPDGNAQWKRQVDFDTSEKFTKAMKKAGLRVIHHTTSTFLPIEAMDREEYKGMFSLDIRNGKIALRDKGTAYSDAVFADMNDPVFRKIIHARMAEYMKRVKPDAFMTDEVEWLPTIYAGGCKRGSWTKFKELYGFDYPGDGDYGNWTSEKWRAFIKFRYDSGRDFYRDLLSVLRKENPHAMISGCLAGISKPWRRVWGMGNETWLSGLSIGFFEMEEASSKEGKKAGYLSCTFWPSYYREMSLYNAHGEANGWINYSLAYPGTYKVDNSEQFYIWALTNAMGHRYWMRDYQAELEWFKWEAENEKDLMKPKLISELGVFFPEYNRDYSKDGNPPYMDWSGISETLAQNGIHFNQLIRWHLDKNNLARFKVIIIPSERFLSGQMLENLKTFVLKGGIIIFTADCAVNNLLGKNNAQNTLAEMLGISGPEEWVEGTYSFTLENEQKSVPAGKYCYKDGYMKVQKDNSVEVLAKITGSEDPAILYHSAGKGSVYFFTGRIGIQMFQDPHQKAEKYLVTYDKAMRKQFAEFIKNILKDKRRVEIDGLPECVMSNSFDTDGYGDGKLRRTVHFLNSSGAYKNGEIWRHKQPYNFTPMSELTKGEPVKIILRDILNVKSAKLISPDFNIPISLASEKLKQNCFSIKIPAEKFGRYTILVLEYD